MFCHVIQVRLIRKVWQRVGDLLTYLDDIAMVNTRVRLRAEGEVIDKDSMLYDSVLEIITK